MRIDLWSDIACPYCYIGLKHLEDALVTFPHRDQVELVLHSFQLDPTMEVNTNESQLQIIVRKYGQPIDKAQQMLAMAANSASTSGVTIDFDKIIATNTLNAHRLIHLAASLGKGVEMKELLFKAYFAEGKHIGNIAELIKLAASLDIDANSLQDSDIYTAEVTQDQLDAKSIGISGVPFFVFDSKYAVSGAQPVASFNQVLQQVWDENLTLPTPVITPEEGCEDGICTI